MKQVLMLIVVFLTHCLTTSLNAQEVFYTGDFDTNFPNPERGYCYSVDPNFENMTWSFCEQDPAKYTATSWTNPMNISQLKYLRASKGFSLVLVRYHIAEFRYKPFSPEFLARLRSDFSTIRDAKFKMIPMFAYNWVGGGPDADAATIVGHLDQLKPIFEENYDVIAFMHLGFIGCWGEMHSSAFGNLDISKGYNRLNDKTFNIINKAFEVMPKERMIAVRTPLYKFQYFNGLNSNAVVENTPISNISQTEAFNQSIRSRWGNHEDCLVCGEWNCGTYNTPANNPQGVISFLENENKYVVQSGESGIVNGCGSPGIDYDGDGFKGSDPRDTCTRVTQMLSRLHWSTINENFNWNNNPSTPKWKEQGCYTEIAKKLGYRFRMVSGIFPNQISNGQSFSISLKIANDGYASCYNKRGVEFIFRNVITGEKFAFPVDDKNIANDPRYWFSGGTYTLTLSNVTLPQSMPSGDYEILINLYDPHQNLRNVPEYSIRLANLNVWEASTGYNHLNKIISVNNATFLNDIKDNQSSYIIIPNPTNNHFFIDKSKFDIVSVDFIDMSGKIVQTIKGYQGDVTMMVPGVYTACINTTNGTVKRKFVKV